MKKLRMKYLDNNHYVISGKAAAYLCRTTTYVHAVCALNTGKLPRCGRERRVSYASFEFWLKRTVTQNKVVWSLVPDYPVMDNNHKLIFQLVKANGGLVK
jgi:hypothetical protein